MIFEIALELVFEAAVSSKKKSKSKKKPTYKLVCF